MDTLTSRTAPSSRWLDCWTHSVELPRLSVKSQEMLMKGCDQTMS